MGIDQLFIIYALIFRLAIIAVGFALIAFGYKLFAKQDQLLKTSVDASFLAAKIRITNTTSGTAFAVIGCILLALMVAKGEPELRRSLNRDGTGDATAGNQLVLRGQATASGMETFDGFVARGIEADKAGDKGTAATAYRAALNLIAAPLNNLAYIDCQNGDLSAAKSLIGVATQISPDQAIYRQTAAEIGSGACKGAAK